jgi:trans-2,3-dihydro-3-hydroxyanthranilate isomerase
MRRRYVTADVFTTRLFEGNPVAVVLDAEGLSGTQMQAVASEFNYSETSFVLPPRAEGHTARVRIFTPRTELPFAGHPNIGTAFVLANQAKAPGGLPEPLIFEEEAGLVQLRLIREEGRVAGAALIAPQALSRRAVVAPEQVARCLSLDAADISTASHAPQVVSVGLALLIVEVASRAALRRATPNLAAFAALLPLDEADAIYLYTGDVHAAEAPCQFEARMFSPFDGIVEDPATGSAAAATCALRADLAPEADTDLALLIGQGGDMGRPSLLETHARKRRGAVEAVQVGGRCVEAMHGSFLLHGEA